MYNTSNKQNTHPQTFVEEYIFLLEEISKISEHKTKLNMMISQSNHRDKARFMMDYYNDLSKIQKRYKARLNAFRQQVILKNNRDLEATLQHIFDMPHSGECQMENGETGTTTIMDGETATQKQQIVTFQDDAPALDAGVSFSRDFQSYGKQSSDKLQNAIVDILQRPMILNESVWHQSDTLASSIWQFSLPSTWYNISPNILNKLDGFRYLRCDFRIKMQVNAQPFNGGCLLMYFVPFEQQLTSAPTSINPAHFGGITGLRHVKLDLSNASSCEMIVPFMCPESHFDLLYTGGLLGTIHCTVYSALRGGTNDVDVTVYCNAENISLDMPTGIPVKRPMLMGQVQMDFEGDDKLSEIEEATRTQANILRGTPRVGPLAPTRAWVSDLLKGSASFFGFSKPNADSLVVQNQLVNNKFLNNYDGTSNPKSLGFSARNAVTTPVGHFQTSEDEMALSHILGKPVYMQRFEMNAAQTSGTELFRWEVAPYNCVGGAPGATQIRFNTYLSYLAVMFRFWRGAIQYHLRIVKTAFHSGRIRVAFIPGGTFSTVVDSDLLSKCYSQIVDIRERDAFNFEIPFISNVPWLQTRWSRNSAVFTTPPCTGIFHISVLNSLRNPSTTADEIEFIVETCAGSDFQFAGPVMDAYQQIQGGPTDLYHSGEAQIDGSNEVVPLFETKRDAPLNATTSCMGEVITSIRQLLRKYTPCSTLAVNTALTFDSVQVSTLLDFFTWSSQLYRFYSGSVRFTTGNTVGGVVRYKLNFPDADLANPPAGQVTTADPMAYVNLTLEPFQEIEVPYYNMTPAMLTNLGKPRPTTTPTNTANSVTFPLHKTGVTITSSNASELLRCVGDDFSFGYLMGPPTTTVRLS